MSTSGEYPQPTSIPGPGRVEAPDPEGALTVARRIGVPIALILAIAAALVAWGRAEQRNDEQDKLLEQHTQELHQVREKQSAAAADAAELRGTLTEVKGIVTETRDDLKDLRRQLIRPSRITRGDGP